MTKRKSYIYENIIEREEYHDGRYGAPGKKRDKKRKATKEQVRKINQYNKSKKARRRLREYFKEDDWLLTLTYRKECRPTDIKGCAKDVSKAIRKLRKIYRKRGYELYWIRNIENTPRNSWHIHLVVKRLPDTDPQLLLKTIWPHGKVYPNLLYENGGFKNLADYITKDENTKKEDVAPEVLDHKITEASYSSSRNMPLTPPKETTLIRWPKEPRVNEGWALDKESHFEGINPVTGYKYRHYTLIRIHRRI
ncbi:MAG: hypothetical protein K1W34_14005 [Lachnospiraceae bacterium]